MNIFESDPPDCLRTLGNDDEVTAPLQIASFNGSYPYPEDFDGSTQIGEQVAYWQSHSGDIGGVNPV